jgi:hypothetical protein
MERLADFVRTVRALPLRAVDEWDRNQANWRKSMSVIVTARLGHRSDEVFLSEQLIEPSDLIAYMKEQGCLHHQLLDLEGTWWLIEEWETSERFEVFFDRIPEFRRALREAGFREFPDELRLWRSIETKEELHSATVAPLGAEGAP